jgi:hypothetical protein
MTLAEESEFYGFPFKLHEQPGWRNAEPALRQRILAAALEYLRKAAPPSDDVVDRSERTAAEFAGGFALELLVHTAPDRLECLAPEDWSKWSAVIVAYRFEGNVKEELFRRARNADPERFLGLVMRALDVRDRSEGGTYNLDDFDCIWGEAFAERLQRKLTDPHWKWKSKEKVLEYLARHRVRGAIDQAKGLLASNTDAEKRIFGARLLLVHDAAGSWELLAPCLRDEPEFAKQFLQAASSETHWDNAWLGGLGEIQLADLYIWLERNFPSEEDPRLDGVFTGRHAVAHMRRATLARLESGGYLRVGGGAPAHA